MSGDDCSLGCTWLQPGYTRLQPWHVWLQPGYAWLQPGYLWLQAEIINGRIAMAAVTIGTALSVDPTLKAFVAISKAATSAVADISD